MTEPHLGGTYSQQLEAARWAESEGLVSFARCDHYMSGGDPTPDATDAFAVLSGLARETSTIRLCVLVTPITFRHPGVIAKNAVTIDQMSGGRLDLGVGTGWNDFEHQALGIPFPESDERWDRLVEAIDYLRAAFGEGDGIFEGRYYSLDLEVRPKPAGVRLIVGGGGPRRTPTLAGTRADEYNLFDCPVDEAKTKIDVMRAAAGDRHVEPTMMGMVRIAGTDDELTGLLEQAASRRNISAEEIRQRWDASGVIYGKPGQVAERMAGFEEAGVERFYLQWLDLADYDGLSRMVELMPR
jgi:alkanesulfonate monooxygenase SsuD/methylene tetrahydromethanopterin reductase-like flavin-dependent oxidoreductase (luciferase family)